MIGKCRHITESVRYVVHPFRTSNLLLGLASALVSNYSSDLLFNQFIHWMRKLYSAPPNLLRWEGISLCLPWIDGKYYIVNDPFPEIVMFFWATIAFPWCTSWTSVWVRFIFGVSGTCMSTVPVSILSNSCSLTRLMTRDMVILALPWGKLLLSVLLSGESLSFDPGCQKCQNPL